MNPITVEELAAICPRTNRVRLGMFVDPLNETMAENSIDTPKRQAAFLPQLAHESNCFLYMREIWGPSQAQRAYEPPSRMADRLGNTEPGDGFRFRGRGLIQITGRGNYRECGIALGLDLEAQPELLELPRYACMSAGWFWTEGAGKRLSPAAKAHGLPDGVNLNAVADLEDILGITLAINGGTNGQDQRLALWNAAKQALA